MTSPAFQRQRIGTPMSRRFPLGEVDLKEGIIPITRAAGSLADTIKRAREQCQPIIVTQNGYPTAAILGIEAYTELRQLAQKYFELLEENQERN